MSDQLPHCQLCGADPVSEDHALETQRRWKALTTPPGGSAPLQKSIEQLAAEKGIGPIKRADDLRIHGITDEEADAFMEAMDSEVAAPRAEGLGHDPVPVCDRCHELIVMDDEGDWLHADEVKP